MFILFGYCSFCFWCVGVVDYNFDFILELDVGRLEDWRCKGNMLVSIM